MPPFLDTLKSLPTRTKAIFAVATVAILGLVFFMMQLAGAPSYTTLASGLEPSTTGKVTAALDEQGIAYELQANGTTVAVDKASVATARVALATAGVSADSGATKGFELFDEAKLGASEFQQKVAYERALSGEISRMVSNVDGVTGAKVQLVLAEDELFADNATEATAAVMLEGSTENLDGDSVRGIAQLVSSSVKSLKAANVTITDPTGRMLWPQGDGDTGGSVGATKLAAEARYERELEAKLNAMLVRAYGPGQGQVQVNADLNVDKTTREELTYGKKGVASELQEETEKMKGGGAGAGGRSGTAGNLPPSYGAGGAGGADSNYQRKGGTTKFAVDKRIDRTEVAPGEVRGLKVALLLPATAPLAPVPANGKTPKAPALTAQAAAVEAAIGTAAGFDKARGDVITTREIPFAKPPAEPKAGPVPVAMLGPLKWAALGLAALVFLFLMWRNLRKREAAALPQPEWLTHIQSPTPLAALEAGSQPTEHATMILPEREPNFQAQAMEQIMEREPDRVAQQVKAWMADD